MSERPSSLTIEVVMTGALSLLLAGNIFFIVRLVDRLERVEEIVYQLRQGVAVLEARLDVANKK